MKKIRFYSFRRLGNCGTRPVLIYLRSIIYPTMNSFPFGNKWKTIEFNQNKSSNQSCSSEAYQMRGYFPEKHALVLISDDILFSWQIMFCIWSLLLIFLCFGHKNSIFRGSTFLWKEWSMWTSNETGGNRGGTEHMTVHFQFTLHRLLAALILRFAVGFSCSLDGWRHQNRLGVILKTGSTVSFCCQPKTDLLLGFVMLDPEAGTGNQQSSILKRVETGPVSGADRQSRWIQFRRAGQAGLGRMASLEQRKMSEQIQTALKLALYWWLWTWIQVCQDR